MKRPLLPRPGQTITPVLVTQLNCDAVIGVDPRRYLEKVVPLCPGHVAEIGKLRAVPVAVVLEAMRTLAGTRATEAGATPIALGDDDELDTADKVLARLGMRRAS